MIDPNYKGEAQLFSWSDTPAGRKITFLLPDEGEEHPFKGFKTGPKYGQCFAIMTQPVDYDNPEEEQTVKSVADYVMPESQRCALLCKQEKFQTWLYGMFPGRWAGVERDLSEDATAESLTAGTLRQYLLISSRREIDTNPIALKTWLSLVSKYEYDTQLIPAYTGGDGEI